MAITFEVRKVDFGRGGRVRAVIAYMDGQHGYEAVSFIGPEHTPETYAAEQISSGRVARHFAVAEIKTVVGAVRRGEVPTMTFDYATADDARAASLQRVLDSIPRELRLIKAFLDTLPNAEVARLLGITVARAAAFRAVVGAVITLDVTA